MKKKKKLKRTKFCLKSLFMYVKIKQCLYRKKFLNMYNVNKNIYLNFIIHFARIRLCVHRKKLF